MDTERIMLTRNVCVRVRMCVFLRVDDGDDEKAGTGPAILKSSKWPGSQGHGRQNRLE